MKIVKYDGWNMNYNKALYKMSKDTNDYMAVFLPRDCIYMNSLRARSNMDRKAAMMRNVYHFSNESPLSSMVKQKFA